jgi:hypothetical protein
MSDEETRYLAILEAMENAEELARQGGYTNLAVALSSLQLMFNTGFDEQARKALDLVSAPIREALAECEVPS